MHLWCLCLLLILPGVTSSTEQVPKSCGREPWKVISVNETFADGTVQDEGGARYPPGCTCTDNSSVTVWGYESQTTCLWQCCPRGLKIEHETVNVPLGPRCVHAGNGTSPMTQFDFSHFHILLGFPCQGAYYPLPRDEISTIGRDGVLVELPLLSGHKYPPGSYCVGEESEGELTALVCWEGETNKTEYIDDVREASTFVIYTVARVIALPFLIATVVVYLVIPELRNLHGKCLASHVTSLAISHVFMIITGVASNSISKGMCVTSGLGAYFFLLASFFWLNVMCFDIWWTFSGHRRGGPQRHTENVKFLFCSVYAWGAAVVILCISIFMDFSPLVSQKYIKPGWGLTKCWLKDKISALVYFYGPIIVLILVNIGFYAVTTVNILRTRKVTRVLNASGNHTTDKNDERRFVLYLKLLLVMGVPWVLEFIGWAVAGPDSIWWIPDVLNILQGVAIFIMFVMKKRVRRLLKQRFQPQPPASPTHTNVTYINSSFS